MPKGPAACGAASPSLLAEIIRKLLGSFADL